jgi:hypothetical protein
MPNGSDHNIATDEGHLLPLNRCEALPINDEAGRKGKMSVRWCCLTGVDNLKTAVYGVCSIW